MMIFFLFVATLNLAIGYALGAGLLNGGPLPALPRITLAMGRSKPQAESDEDETGLLTRPVAVETEPLPQSAAEPAPVAEAPTPEPAAPAEEPAPEPGIEAKPNRPKSADSVLNSLSQFREKLSHASGELRKNQSDADQFGECANKLQQANHDYLEHANDAIERLGEMGEEGEGAREAVSSGVGKVAQISGDFDEMVGSGDFDEQARAKMVEQSEAIDQAAGEVEQAVAEQSQPGNTAFTDLSAPANALASAEALLDELERLCETQDSDQVCQVAAIQIDPLESIDEDQSLIESIKQSLRGITSQMLEPHQRVSGGDQLYLLLSGDTIDDATERLDKIRQTVAACDYHHDGKSFKATVSCAVTEADNCSREMLRERLNDALEESSRGGHNGTYHHDGAFPTLVEAVDFRAPLMKLEV